MTAAAFWRFPALVPEASVVDKAGVAVSTSLAKRDTGKSSVLLFSVTSP